MKSRRAIVLGAGKGKRLQSELHDLPKVLRQACGKPLVGYVLDKLSFLPSEAIALVIGYKGEQVQAQMGDAYAYFWQHEQLGTGHAVQMAEDFIKDFDGLVLICYGDMPLISQETYEGLFKRVEESGAEAALLAWDTPLPLPYGRVIRDEKGDFQEVIEDRDCNEEQKKVTELNAGVYVFEAKALLEALKKLKNSNAQGEYYITDVPAHILNAGGRVVVYQSQGYYEGYGVNTEEDLAQVEACLNQ